MRRKSRDRGTLVVTFTDVEVGLLVGLLDELDELASDPPVGDPVTDRLFPAGYADAAAAWEFRELTQSSLQHERQDRYGQCRAELPVPAGDLVIEPDTVQRWLVVLNDMRLALGTRLGVTADGFAAEDEAAGSGREPAIDVYAAQAAYRWLTAVQDDIVSSVLP